MGRLLVIEDDERLAQLMVRALHDCGHSVTTETAGGVGLRTALAHDFDLVVLDLMLPDLDGVEVLHRLVEARADQRVLVLSAVSEIGTRVACLEAGAADFLAKPFVVAELIARIGVRLRTPPPGAVRRWLSLGPVRLDLRLRRVCVEGREAELSFREFLLLQHLMHRGGQACSRAELLADVWGLTFDPRSNIVDVCIGRLRGKMDHPGRIETVRHVGYRFVAA